MTMTRKVHIYKAITLSGNVPTGHNTGFPTHKATFCIRHHLLLAAYYKTANPHTNLLFPSVFSLQDIPLFMFNILPPTTFADLCDRLVCLVLKPAVILLVQSSEPSYF